MASSGNYRNYHYSQMQPASSSTYSQESSNQTRGPSVPSSSAWFMRDVRDGGGTNALNSSIYDNHYVPPTESSSQKLADSVSSSEETGTTRSTVRTVNFRNPPAVSHTSPEIGSSVHMTESIQVEQMLTDEVIVAHPRTLIILASIQSVVAVQILVFGMIASFYGGCPYGTALWTSILFIASGSAGLVFVKAKPRRWLLYIYTMTTCICFILTLLLFVVTASLLDQEDDLLRRDGFNFIEQHILQLNRIVEHTKIAMYTLHLLLTPIHGICCGASGVLLFLNLKDAQEGKVHKGYYVSNSQLGHQTVLVPIELKQVKEMPNTESKRSIAIQTSTLMERNI